MSRITAIADFANNKLLSGLPTSELERLLPHFEKITLPRNKVLFQARDRITHCYFATSGLISMLGKTRAKDFIGIAMVGSEGMIGVPLVLQTEVTPYELRVQIPGEALKIDAQVFQRELKEGGEFADRLLKYSNTLLDQMGQALICNHSHSIEARFCSELLVTCDRVGSETLHLTHEIISYMLGTSRTGVTRVANELRDAGFIDYRREKITVSNRAGIERLACECYHVNKVELNQLAASIVV